MKTSTEACYPVVAEPVSIHIFPLNIIPPPNDAGIYEYQYPPYRLLFFALLKPPYARKNQLSCYLRTTELLFKKTVGATAAAAFMSFSKVFFPQIGWKNL